MGELRPEVKRFAGNPCKTCLAGDGYRHGKTPSWSQRLAAMPGLSDVSIRFEERWAQDVVQEVFLRAWRAADSYDARLGGMRTWLFTIVRNVVSIESAAGPLDR